METNNKGRIPLGVCGVTQAERELGFISQYFEGTHSHWTDMYELSSLEQSFTGLQE